MTEQRAAKPAIMNNERADNPAIPKIKADNANVEGSALVLSSTSGASSLFFTAVSLRPTII
jgi:hypothetical protein